MIAKKPVAYLCSYPKTGRTWLRFMLAQYLRVVFSLDIRIDFATCFRVVPNLEGGESRGPDAYAFQEDERVPLVLATHDFYTNQFEDARVASVVRAIPDVLVSRYFHLTRQWHKSYENLHVFLVEGVEHLSAYLNSWAPRLLGPDAWTTSYERLHADGQTDLLALADFLDVPVESEAARQAVETSSFDRMRKLEMRKPLPGHSYDVTDPNARRIRQGEVGGYQEHMGPAELEFIRDRCAELLAAPAQQLLGDFGLWPIA